VPAGTMRSVREEEIMTASLISEGLMMHRFIILPSQW
jgi:hypothetical protein